MALTLYYHPLSSYCWKTLIALYEHGTDFTPRLIDLGNTADRDTLYGVWPMLRFPVLEDDAHGVAMPESSSIIDYLALHHPGAFRPVPDDADAAIEVRLMDRLFDLDIMTPMQKIVADRLRPADAKDPYGVDEARAKLAKSYNMIEARMTGRTWAAGADFTLADCAAAPALYYANKVAPFRDSHSALSAYLTRLEARESVARVLEEAAPYLAMFPA